MDNDDESDWSELDESDDEPELLSIPNFTTILNSIKRNAYSKASITTLFSEIKDTVDAVALDPNSYSGIEDYNKQVRLLVFAANRYIVPKPKKLEDLLKSLTDAVGPLPLPNNNITKSIDEVGVTIRKNNILHNREEVKKRVGFYKKNKRAIVRTLLLSEEESRNRAFSTSSEKQYFISHANSTLYAESADLHADHLQPAAQIIDRQIELLDAMNLFPDFATDMCLRHPDYFRQDRDGHWYGTRKFFMDYHNCLENLWLMNGGANVGKQSSDPIEYLKNHPRFGERFFKDLAKQGPISKQGIIYTVNNVPLAKLAKEWFNRTYHLTRDISYAYKESEEQIRASVIAIDELAEKVRAADTNQKEVGGALGGSKRTSRNEVRRRQKEEEAIQPMGNPELARAQKIIKNSKKELRLAASMTKHATAYVSNNIKQRQHNQTGHTDALSDTESGSSSSRQEERLEIDKLIEDEMPDIMGRFKGKMQDLKSPPESEKKKKRTENKSGGGRFGFDT
jgi:hypothetical protein